MLRMEQQLPIRFAVCHGVGALLLFLGTFGSAGCVWFRPTVVPRTSEIGETTFVREQLILHADFPLERTHPVLDELLALRLSMAQQLSLPTSEESIHVYLYQTATGYEERAKRYFPASQARRAFFVKSSERLNVHAQWGNSAAIDLRHELTHGYLHASLRTLPLWLDEGLAEFFELPPEQRGRSSEHIAWLRNERTTHDWSPDLLRLEALTNVATMTQTDYAEAWLWTHWLLSDNAERKAWLTTYLSELRRDNTLTPFSLKIRPLMSQPHRELLKHLDSL
jgi:Protein of unknown function (DUF1570)